MTQASRFKMDSSSISIRQCSNNTDAKPLDDSRVASGERRWLTRGGSSIRTTTARGVSDNRRRDPAMGSPDLRFHRNRDATAVQPQIFGCKN